jgi:hypothetical protein
MPENLAAQISISDRASTTEQAGTQAGRQIEGYPWQIIFERDTTDMPTKAGAGTAAAPTTGRVAREFQLFEVDLG